MTGRFLLGALHEDNSMSCGKLRLFNVRVLVIFAAVLLVAPVLNAIAAPVPAATELDDVPEPLKPKQAQTEIDRNRIEALSLFAAARTEEERGNFNAALRLYQRALRYDPRALPVLRRVVEVAQQLDRIPEAIRYAQRAVQLEASDPRLVISLAEQLTEQNDFNAALKLFELARSQPQVERKSAIYLTLTLQIGRLKFLTGDVQAAGDAFATVLEGLDKPDEYGLNVESTRLLTGKDERNFELFGEALLAANRPELAERAFEKAQARATSKELYRPIYAYHQAEILAHRKQYSEALKQLDAYFTAKETRHEEAPYQLFEKILQGLKQQDQFVSRLAGIAQDDPGNAPLNLFLARRYAEEKNWTAAERHYRELLNTASAAQAYRGLVNVYRKSEKPESLLKTLAEAVEKGGGVEVVARDAKSISGESKELDALVAQAKKLREKSPAGLSHGAKVVLAMMLLDAKRFDEAGEYFRMALDAHPKEAAELYFTWGLGLLNADKYAQATAVFQRGLNEKVLPNDNPLFQTYLALSLEMDGRTEEALKVARGAAQLAGGKNSRLESRVCWILYHSKRYRDALAAYERLLSRFDSEYGSEDNRRVMREARLAMSNICVTTGDMPKAEEYLEQILDEFPEDVSALNDLGYLWADRGKNLSRALEMVQQAVTSDPDNEAYRDSLGWAFFRLGRHQEALVELKKAAEVDDPDSVILDHVADCLHALGKNDEARQYWERAVKKIQKDGDSSKLDAIEAKLKKLSEPKK